MGCISSDTNQPGLQPSNFITVASLNYCGIMNSPFEFYCDDYLVELKDISKEYLNLLPQYFPQFDKASWKWNMGKIDLKFRNRYSPMFQADSGITQSNCMMSRQEFEGEWEKIFEKQVPKIKVQFTPEQKQVTKVYDVLMYHTLLKYVFNIVEIKDIQGKDAQPYKDKLRPFFQLSFLDEQRKAEKVKENMGRVNADVFFFQQYSRNFYEVIEKTKEYYLHPDESRDTLIIAKKSSFKEKPANAEVVLKSQPLGQDIYNNLNWNERSSFLIIEKYIFINAHLSSKADRNREQIEQLKQGLIKLREKSPEYEVIVAGDLNSFLPPFSETFHIFPEKETEMTTVKKRTFTQGQFNKADKVVRESKDKVISTLKISDGKISYITGAEPSNQNLVPTDEHPFDHFVIVCYLQKKPQGSIE